MTGPRRRLYRAIWGHDPHGVLRRDTCEEAYRGNHGHRYHRLWRRQILTGCETWCWRTWITNTFALYRSRGPWRPSDLWWVRTAYRDWHNLTRTARFPNTRLKDNT